MARKKTLRLACDSGASAFKVIGSQGEKFLALVISPEAIEQHSDSLDSYRCQISSDLLHRSFVGVNGKYFAVGSLAHQKGAIQTLKPLKSETIVYKILAAVSIMAQRLDLGISFDLQLGCLLPFGEFADRENIQTNLALALADFDTPIGVFNVNLQRCDFYPEGMGMVELQQVNHRQMHGTGVTLMAGHRNLTFYATESNMVAKVQTCDLGFNHWAKTVRERTYDYDLRSLAPAIATYWIKKDEKALDRILRNKNPEFRRGELERLIDVIDRSCHDYCNLIFKWLDEHLPDRIDELMIAGGVGDVLQAELIEYFAGKLTPNPQYQNKYVIFNSSVFNLPTLDVPDEYQSRMADVYCMWKYLMPQPKIKAKTTKTK
ncbi:ParM/StbA family protein [Chamaesiphon polymorphus]|uniref:ParM/StbA family protein n=1 Tax=Chamaesiphon polymorphus TaxID=2107691 RepID=UPI0011B21A21|nr:ParM/StbA family protein [Chamaesiphon polymorphus]